MAITVEKLVAELKWDTNRTELAKARTDADKLKANVDTMMDSCGRFIDFTRIDIIPTSQFDVG